MENSQNLVLFFFFFVVTNSKYDNVWVSNDIFWKYTLSFRHFYQCNSSVLHFLFVQIFWHFGSHSWVNGSFLDRCLTIHKQFNAWKIFHSNQVHSGYRESFDKSLKLNVSYLTNIILPSIFSRNNTLCFKKSMRWFKNPDQQKKLLFQKKRKL